jgi:hypothetical protein
MPLFRARHEPLNCFASLAMTAELDQARSNTAASPARRRCTSSPAHSVRRGAQFARQIGEDAAAGRADRMAERNARSVDVETLRLSRSSQPQPLSTASTCGAKASLSSTRSISSQPSPVRANRRSTAGTGPMPMREGSQPAAAQLWIPGDRLEAEFLQLVLGDDQAGRGGVVLLAGIARGDDPAFFDRRSAPSDSSVASARKPSSCAKITGSPLRCGTERAPVRRRTVLGPGSGRALVAHHRIFVARLAADVIILRQIFGGLDHAGDDAEAFDRLRHQPPARQAVVHGRLPGTRALAHVDL